MLTLATAFFVKVLLDSVHKCEGEFYPVGMWFVAACMDFVLLVALLVLLYA
jgi:uncharacterized membrane protein